MNLFPKPVTTTFFVIILFIVAVSVMVSHADGQSLAQLISNKGLIANSEPQTEHKLKIQIAISPAQKEMLRKKGYFNFDYLQIRLIQTAADQEAKEILYTIHKAEETFFADKKYYSENLDDLNIALPKYPFHQYIITAINDSTYIVNALAIYGDYSSYAINQNGVVAKYKKD